jgi:hypothetical protein
MTPTLITIQTAAPRGRFPGAVAQAFFIVENNRVVLTDCDGNVLHDPEGRDYTRALGEGDNPHQVAVLLLRRFRTKIRGGRVAGFEPGPLNYSPVSKY